METPGKFGSEDVETACKNINRIAYMNEKYHIYE